MRFRASSLVITARCGRSIFVSLVDFAFLITLPAVTFYISVRDVNLVNLANAAPNESVEMMNSSAHLSLYNQISIRKNLACACKTG